MGRVASYIGIKDLVQTAVCVFRFVSVMHRIAGTKLLPVMRNVFIIVFA